MSGPAPLTVLPQERGFIRIFKLDMDDAGLQKLRNPKGDEPSKSAALAHMLGLDWLNEAHIEIFDVADLDELGLSGYLTQGNGVDEADIAENAELLKTVEGWVVILYSAAFEGRKAELRPDRQLGLIGMWQEARDEVTFKPLPDKSAKGVVPPSEASQPINPPLTVLWAILALPILVLIVGALIYGVIR